MCIRLKIFLALNNLLKNTNTYSIFQKLYFYKQKIFFALNFVLFVINLIAFIIACILSRLVKYVLSA